MKQYSRQTSLPSVPWRCWLGGKKGIWPLKNCGGVLAWSSVWSEVQTCIWLSWCHCHSLVSCFSKIQIGLPFWYRLTRVVPDKGPLNGRVCVCVIDKLSSFLFSPPILWIGEAMHCVFDLSACACLRTYMHACQVSFLRAYCRVLVKNILSYYYYTSLTASFPGQPGYKPVPER